MKISFAKPQENRMFDCRLETMRNGDYADLTGTALAAPGRCLIKR
jgi:hypothetical protein